tara:strand:- start:294 stop:461 length:168 start_codon:yes stop_codon:yes gene_type:complete
MVNNYTLGVGSQRKNSSTNGSMTTGTTNTSQCSSPKNVAFTAPPLSNQPSRPAGG